MINNLDEEFNLHMEDILNIAKDNMPDGKFDELRSAMMELSRSTKNPAIKVESLAQILGDKVGRELSHDWHSDIAGIYNSLCSKIYE